MSERVQASLSSQRVPSGLGVPRHCPLMGSQTIAVLHASPGPQSIMLAPTQVPD